MIGKEGRDMEQASSLPESFTVRERALQRQEKECRGDGKSCIGDNF
jgi:hypothetical protein